MSGRETRQSQGREGLERGGESARRTQQDVNRTSFEERSRNQASGDGQSSSQKRSFGRKIRDKLFGRSKGDANRPEHPREQIRRERQLQMEREERTNQLRQYARDDVRNNPNAIKPEDVRSIGHGREQIQYNQFFNEERGKYYALGENTSHNNGQ